MHSWQISKNKKINYQQMLFLISNYENKNNITNLNISTNNEYLIILTKNERKIFYKIIYIEKHEDKQIFSTYVPIYDKNLKIVLKELKNNLFRSNEKIIIYNTKDKNFDIKKQWWINYFLKTKHTDKICFIEKIHNIENGIYKYNETKKPHLKKYKNLTDFKYLKSNQIMFIDKKYIIIKKKIYNYKKHFKPWFNRFLNLINLHL